MQNFDFKEQVKNFVADEFRKDALDEAAFHHEKAREAFLAFKEFGKSEPVSFFEAELKRFEDFGGTYKDYLPTLEAGSKRYNFFVLIGKVVAYFDTHGYNKNIWNEYTDKRVVAKAGVRQTIWVKTLIQYKIYGNDISKIKTGSVKNSIIYIENPKNGLTLLSEDHRKMVSENLLKKEFNSDTFVKDFLDYLSDVKIPVKNSENKNAYICFCLYEDEVKKAWEINEPNLSKKEATALIGLYLSKFGDDNNEKRFPGKTWREIYLLFAPKLASSPERYINFSNNLKANRDSFDGHFENSREGWKEEDGKPLILRAILKKIFDEYHDQSEEELWNLVNKFLPKINSESSTEINYWIFQCNPNIYDIISSLNQGDLKSWLVKAHKDKIKKGDKGIIWVTGKENGCYALIKVESDPFEGMNEATDKKHYIVLDEDVVSTRSKISIEHNLSNAPIYYEEIKDEPWFQGFKGGGQGTNFQLTKEQYLGFLNIIEDLSKPQYWIYRPGTGDDWDKLFDEQIAVLWYDQVGDISKYANKSEIIEFLQKKENKEASFKNIALGCWQFYKELKKGDILFAAKGHNTLLGYGIIEGEFYYDNSAKEMKNRRKVKWVKKEEINLPQDWKFVQKQLTNITRYTDYVTKLKALLGIDTLDIPMKKTKKSVENVPLNQIYYGPPGTGKTYSTKIDALDILGIDHDKDNIGDVIEKFEKAQSDGLVKFITFHQSYSYEQFIESILPKLQDEDDDKSTEIKYHLKDGVFKDLSLKALSNLLEPTTKEKEIRSDFEARMLKLEDEIEAAGGYLELATSSLSNNFKISITQTEGIQIDHGGKFLLNIARKRLKEIYNALLQTDKNQFERKDIVNVGFNSLSTYSVAIMNKLFGYKVDQTEKIQTELIQTKEKVVDVLDLLSGGEKKYNINEDANNYVLIIDEINRGNVSRIFGELITLIEPNKRIGSDEPMIVTLPTTGNIFGVPNNLYIIGTMNTADRSVEALDTALRRRFSFKEISTNSRNVDKIPNLDLGKMLDTINARIEKLLDRDHCIGHSYLMNLDEPKFESLKINFQNKIIPLLQEYFYGDWGKIGMILGAGFVKTISTSMKFAKFKNSEDESEEDFEERKVYRITNPNEWNLEVFKKIYEEGRTTAKEESSAEESQEMKEKKHD